MKFGEVIEAIKLGRLARRKIWAANIYICKCSDVVMDKSELNHFHTPTASKVKILNSASKNVLIQGGVKLVHPGSDVIGSKSFIEDYTPNWVDILSEDWELV